jgi:protein-tyrosine-phosphatase
MSRPYRICLVCTGNTCRSPMAMGILQQLATERGFAHWEITSAGLSAFTDAPATAHAVAVAHESGVDLTHHQAQRFTPQLAVECDLILALSGEHYEEIRTWGPAIAARTFLLKAFPATGNPGATAWVRDPIGGEVSEYRKTFMELDETVRRILPELGRRATTIG